MPTIQFKDFLPCEHTDPVHSDLHVQVSGQVQFPLMQGSAQMAVRRILVKNFICMKFIVMK